MKTANPAGTVYFVGIKGIAMSALAIFLKQKGYHIAGSDTGEVFPSDTELKQHKIKVLTGFSPDHINVIHPDMVVYTGAHGGSDNPEVRAAVKLGIPVYPHGRALGKFMKEFVQVSVAGCHGKTTTASMIVTAMVKSGFDPSYAVGVGSINSVGPAGHFGRDKWFIAEADEYVTDPASDHTPRFMWQFPEILVVTNVDFDHPDVYPDMQSVTEAYRKLAGNVAPQGLIVANSDDPNSEYLFKLPQTVAVGTSAKSDYLIQNIRSDKQESGFCLYHRGRKEACFILNVPGMHNIRNAALAAVALNRMGLAWDQISRGLAKYTGSKRRFELLSTKNQIKFYDDYAHHPNEIKATLDAIRAWYPESRIIAVFQPHTYSRTIKLLAEFGKAFSAADMTIISDIYASAREKPVRGFSGNNLSDQIQYNHTEAKYVPTPEKIGIFLKEYIRKGDVVVFMGAGDIYNWEKDVIAEI